MLSFTPFQNSSGKCRLRRIRPQWCSASFAGSYPLDPPIVPNREKERDSFFQAGRRALLLGQARRNVELARTLYPGWLCRFYVDENTSSEQLNTFAGRILKSSRGKRRHDFDGSFWRFSAASDPAVDIVLFRDCDPELTPRSSCAVDAWLRSGKDFHIMRDHPWHAAPILSGMWGCRADALRNIDRLMARWMASSIISSKLEIL